MSLSKLISKAKYRRYTLIRCTIIFILFACWNSTKSQSNPGLDFVSLAQNPYLAPPSPEAASFLKNANYPVSHYSGIPDISIPIYTIKTNTLTLPLSLSYSAGGIKVDEIASWAGLGWTMEAGGCISLSILDKPDKDIFEIPDAASLRNQGTGKTFLRNLHTDMDAGYYSAIDKSKDRYSFLFNNNSGYFYIMDQGHIESVPMTSDKILRHRNPISNETTGFVITLANGETYHFFDLENVNIYSQTRDYLGNMAPSNPHTAGQTWYLSKIVNSNRTDSISFVYEDDNTVYTDFIGMEGSFSSNVRDGAHIGGANQYSETYSLSRTVKETTKSKILKEIRYDGGHVMFIRVNDRTDARRHRLSKVEIYRENVLERYVEFNNIEYFDSYRMKLGSVFFKGKDHVLYDSYAFEYFQDQGLPAPLTTSWNEFENFNPYFSQDLCGYYNGKHNGSVLHHLPPILRSFERSKLIADRSFSFEHARTYTLKKIRYITGGETEFIYGAGSGNLARSPALRIQEEIVRNSSGEQDIALKKKYNYVGYTFPHIPVVNGNYSSVSNKYEQYFNLLQTTHFRTYTYSSGATVPGYTSPRYDYTAVEELLIDNSSQDTLKTLFEYDTPSGSIMNDQTPFRYNVHSLIPDIWEAQAHPSMSYDSYTNDLTYYTVPGYILDNKWTGGSLLAKTIYRYTDGGFQILQRTDNTYVFNKKNDSLKTGFYLAPVFYLYDAVGTGIPPNYSYDDYRKYYFFDIMNSTGVKVLASSRTEEYTPQGKVTKNTYFQHDINNHFLKHKIEQIGDDQHNFTHYSYPTDSAHIPIFQKMVLRNQINKPITTRTSYDRGTITKGEESQTLSYIEEAHNGKVLIHPSEYSYTISKETQGVLQQTGEYSTDILKTDFKGNPLHVVNQNGESTVYLWGYRNSLKIAEIKNASYADILSIINESTYSTISAKAQPSELDYALINTLRTALSQAQVSTYKYNIFGNLTLHVDASNKSKSYSYDGAGRLSNILDNDGNILKHYKYHHQTSSMISLSIANLASQYLPNETMNVSVGVTGVSGSYSIDWLLADKENNIVASKLNTASSSFTHTFSSSGVFTLHCSIKELASGIVVETSKQIQVTVPLEFTNIFYNINGIGTPEMNPFCTADIVCDKDVSVTFEFIFEDHTWAECDKIITYKVDGNTYTLTNDTPLSERTYELKKGTTRLEVHIDQGFYGPNTDSSIRMKSASGGQPIIISNSIIYFTF